MVDGVIGTLLGNALKAGIWGLAGGVEAATRSGIESGLTAINKMSGKDLVDPTHFGPLGSIFYWEDFYKNVKDANQELGISDELARNMEKSFQRAFEGFVPLGGTIEDITAAYKAFVQLTSTNRLVNPEDLQTLAKFRLAFGEGYEAIFSTMALYGASIEDTNREISKAFRNANSLGLNAANVIQQIQKNIDLLDKYSFDNGIEGLSKMVMLSERYKINMSSAANFVDKSLDLDSVMEMSAQLMVLGGEFSKLGDPFTLMATARSNPELLIQKITDLAGAYAHLNTQTGTFTVDPYGMDMIRQFATITGVAADELTRAAKIGRMRIEVESNIAPQLRQLEDYETIVDRISSGAYFKNGTLGIDIKAPDGKVTFKSVANISPTDLETISAVNEDIPLESITQDLIQTNQTLIGSINALIETLKRYIIPETLYQEARTKVEPAIQGMAQGIDDNDQLLGLKEYFEKTDRAILDNLLKLGGTIGEEVSTRTKSTEQPNTFNNFLFKESESTSFLGTLWDMAKMPFEAYDSFKSAIADPAEYFGLTSNEDEMTSTNTDANQLKYDQIKELLISRGNELDISNNQKIEFSELSGIIKVMTDSGIDMGNIDINQLWKEIKPMIEEKIKSGIYDTMTNQPKNNPTRQTPFF